jgi:hypothetical protein
VLRDVAAASCGVILMWTVDSLGWDHASADAIIDRCLRLAEAGAIYVASAPRSQDAAALPPSSPSLRDGGPPSARSMMSCASVVVANGR